MAQAGRLPQAGEVVEYQGMTFRIERLEGRRIRRVRLERRAGASPAKAVVSIALFLAGLTPSVIAI
jgi:CBS domain containing-hemolysin-like protein